MTYAFARYIRIIRFSVFALTACTTSIAGAQMMGSGMRGGMMGPGMMDGPPQSNSGGSRPAREFQQICSQCHAPPSPGLHTAAQWPQVVSRMEQIMRATGQPLPDRHTMDDIIGYLETNARNR